MTVDLIKEYNLPEVFKAHRETYGRDNRFNNTVKAIAKREGLGMDWNGIISYLDRVAPGWRGYPNPAVRIWKGEIR